MRPAGLALVAALLATSCQPFPARGTGPTAASSASSAARAARSPVAGGTFTEAVAGIAGYLNPLFADEDNARDIDSLVYQGLTQAGTDQQPKPLLAREIQLSADHLTYSVRLRGDVKWADGQPFTRHGRATFNLARRDGRWLAVHSHVSLLPSQSESAHGRR